MNQNNKLNENALEGFLEFAQEANTRSTLAVEDGLKPVHRRILYGMAQDKIWATGQHTGSAKIVGAILGNYHPHGDASVYDAAVRLSQDFKLRYPLIDFYGNNGSILDPDSYAASRYTKMKLTPLGQMMLEDIDKNTVDMVENYNGELMEPVVLPSMIPNTLLNGGMGIGVGVSSSLVPHNLGELVDGINAYIKNPRITTVDLLQYIQGPDFPTGGIITDSSKLESIYESGKGTITLRSKYRIENIGGRPNIVVTESPYLINIESRIIAVIQQMVAEEGYDKIYEVQNSSGKHGLEIRIILEKDANPTSVIQTLIEKTGFETTVKINNTVMLSDGSFVTLGLRGLISYYLKHQHDILIRKYTWEKQKAQERLHIVEGLIIAVNNIDEVVRVIKTSATSAAAKVNLIKQFDLSNEQAAAILDMRLARLTSLEINKLMNEKKELEKTIAECTLIISSEAKRETIISKFLNTLKENFADERRTKIVEMGIIEKGEHVYLMVEAGKITSISKDEIAVVNRGKKGSAVGKNPITSALECNTKEQVLAIDKIGKAYLASAQDFINGVVEFDNDLVLILRPEEKDYIIFTTQAGIIKKTPSVKIRKTTQVTKVHEDDCLVGMHFATDKDFIMVLGSEGKLVNIPVSDIPSIGKLTYGAKGIETSKVLASCVAGKEDLILTTTQDSQAKLTKHSDFLVNARATSGQLITEDCTNILNIGTGTHITLFGSNNRAITVVADSIAIKGRNSVGAKIFDSKITTMISL